MADSTTDTTGTTIVDPNVGQQTGSESSLSSWAGDYVTDMLGKGQALANQDYQAYTGPLTAGVSDLQAQAFQGLGSLQAPQQQAFTQQSFTDQGIAQQYMNPYLQQALQPQIDEARRQAQIEMLSNNAAATKAGAYGGSRSALMNLESQRNLLSNLANVTGQGYRDAYNQAAGQFNTEQNLGLQTANQNNMLAQKILADQLAAGQTQRGITSEGMAADLAQFEEERDFPYKQVQYQQSLLQGLPIAAQSYSYTEPSTLSTLLGTSGGIMDFYDKYIGGE